MWADGVEPGVCPEAAGSSSPQSAVLSSPRRDAGLRRWVPRERQGFALPGGWEGHASEDAARGRPALAVEEVRGHRPREAQPAREGDLGGRGGRGGPRRFAEEE